MAANQLKDGLYANFRTTKGDILCRLEFKKTPMTVANFVGLADGSQEWTDPKTGAVNSTPLYDGVVFHRVIPGFMIQGGDPLTKDPGKSGLFGTGGNTDKAGKPLNVKAEFNDVSHRRGVLSMARASDPDSASSQFFVVVKDSPFLDRQYTVFGEVVKGLEVVDKIVTESNSDTSDPRSGGKPRAYQKILRIELVEQAPDKA